MDTNRIKKLFVEGSIDRIERIKAKLGELKKKREDMGDLLMDIYIMAHGINSSSVFLPIKPISNLSKAIEKQIKQWLDDSFAPSAQQIKEIVSDLNKLKKMIKDIDKYFGEIDL